MQGALDEVGFLQQRSLIDYCGQISFIYFIRVRSKKVKLQSTELSSNNVKISGAFFFVQLLRIITSSTFVSTRNK